MTYNACATMKWNQGVSWPVESGHGCLGCSEPDFWDAGGFYKALSIPTSEVTRTAAAAVAAGAVIGAAVGLANRAKKSGAAAKHQTVTVDQLGEK